MIRAQLGPMARRDARRAAEQLAMACRGIFDDAARKRRTAMELGQTDNNDRALVEQVVVACQAAIARAVKQPKSAIGLARSLSSALTSLQLIESEVGKGADGAQAVVTNADALARQALTQVLTLTPNPSQAKSALAMVTNVAPLPSNPALPIASVFKTALPTFGDVSRAYIAMRKAVDGDNHPDIKYLELRRQTFIDLIGDRPVDQYFPNDLQDYVTAMQFWPANATKRAGAGETRTILDSNRSLALKPLARKTMQDGYLANVKTMMRFGMMKPNYRDPFAGARIRWPKTYGTSAVREGVDDAVINATFRNGIATGLLAEAMLPVLAKLTGRRIGLLAHLRGSDFREKYGAIIAQTSGIVLVNGRWQRVPIKTEESATYFVIHDFFRTIGFVNWAQKRADDWVFAALHEHPDPSKYASKEMNKLLRKSGAIGANIEVFHSLRGDAIDDIRNTNIKDRSRRLQTGHELGDVHDLYGFRALGAAETQQLARRPLAGGIDWTVFEGLDFEALAKARHKRGRRSKLSRQNPRLTGLRTICSSGKFCPHRSRVDLIMTGAVIAGKQTANENVRVFYANGAPFRIKLRKYR
ncbi:hypothetical protein [Afipia felis]|nr:hypothetical protein [Afipia felis]